MADVNSEAEHVCSASIFSDVDLLGYGKRIIDLNSGTNFAEYSLFGSRCGWWHTRFAFATDWDNRFGGKQA